MNDFRVAFKTLMRRNVMAMTGMTLGSHGSLGHSWIGGLSVLAALLSHQVGRLIAIAARADNRLSKTLLHT